MFHAMLPLFLTVLAPTTTPPREGHDLQVARIAQVQLAAALGAADSIDAVSARGHVFTFALDIHGEAVELTVTTDGDDAVVTLTAWTREGADAEAGPLTWLAAELGDAVAVTSLSTGPRPGAAVALTTADDRRYLLVRVPAPTGNTGAEARWAAAWGP